MREAFLGVDIGTSSIKAVLFDNNGNALGIKTKECSITSKKDGMAEVSPQFIFDTLIYVMKTCLENVKANDKCLCGIGISCHMHSLMAVDERGEPLTPVILWADTRAKEEAKLIEKNFDVGNLYNKTGCRVQHPMYPLSKILWLRENEGDIFNKAYKFITLKEYIIFKLFGRFIVDYTLAASQGYFNIRTHKWDEEILRDILKIDRNKLSEVVECTYNLKGMKEEFAKTLCIDSNIPLNIGSGDGILANLGCGVYDNTAMSSTIGTSGAIRTATNFPLLDSKQRTWCYAFTKELWVVGGAINNGGIILKWFREEFKKQFEGDALPSGKSIYDLFSELSGEIRPGSDGLIFLPYLMGERSPDWNADVRGLMYGLSFNHSKKHLLRAAMEGVIYRLYSVYEVMEGLTQNICEIRANGGYAVSNTWLQMQADVFNKPVAVSKVTEASALGAAFLSMVACGFVKDFTEILPAMKPEKYFEPIKENNDIYIKTYAKAMEIYNKLY